MFGYKKALSKQLNTTFLVCIVVLSIVAAAAISYVTYER